MINIIDITQHHNNCHKCLARGLDWKPHTHCQLVGVIYHKCILTTQYLSLPLCLKRNIMISFSSRLEKILFANQLYPKVTTEVVES